MSRTIDRAVRLLALVGGAVLLAIMAVTVADVVMRYLFGAPITGVLDLTELGLVLVTFLGMAYCGRSGGHVAVDLLGALAPRRVLRWTDAFIRLACAALFALLAWESLNQSRLAAASGEASMLLLIPHYPFFAVIALGAALYAVVLLLQAVDAARGREIDADLPSQS